MGNNQHTKKKIADMRAGYEKPTVATLRARISDGSKQPPKSSSLRERVKPTHEFVSISATEGLIMGSITTEALMAELDKRALITNFMKPPAQDNVKQPKGEIYERLDGLSGAINMLHSATERLHGRLGPILTDDLNDLTKTAGADTAGPTTSNELSRRVFSMECDVNAVMRLVNDALGRLALP